MESQLFSKGIIKTIQKNETTISSDIKTPEMSNIIQSLEKGSEVLDMLGTIQYPDPIYTDVKNVAKSLKDLIQKVRTFDNDKFNNLGVFLDSLFTFSIIERIISPENTNVIINVITNLVEQEKNPNVSIAMKNAIRDTKFIYKCSCGFLFPKYVGKYPSVCPRCSSLVDKSKFGKYDAFNLGAKETLPSYYFCNQCGDNIFGNIDTEYECSSCKSIMIEDTFENQMISALLELFCFCSYSDQNKDFFVYEGKEIEGIFNKFNIKLRDKNIFESLKLRDSKNIYVKFLINLLKDSISLKDSIKNSFIKESIESDEYRNFCLCIEKFDPATLLSLYPIIKQINSIKKLDLFDNINKKIGFLTSSLFEAISLIKSRSIILDEDLRNKIMLFMDSLYTTQASPLDIDNKYSSEMAEKFILNIVNKDILIRLREEILKRPKLLKSLSEISLNNFNLDDAIKAYSSCLTRVCIEHELNKTLGLDLLRPILLENMAELISGNKSKAINFLKGIFLSKENRK
jgi:predicted Zn-ribbon and HTH transcriptional regulator